MLCVTLALSKDGRKPCKKRDSRNDRPGSNIAFKGDDGDYERSLTTLESECTQDNPSAKSVRRLMKATFNGMFGQIKYMTVYRYCVHPSYILL